MNVNIELFKLFAISSTFTFSGGLAMIPMLHDKLVTENNYLSNDEFYHYIALSQSLPGVTAVISACLLGEKINGKKGRLAASFGAILPILFLMIALTMIYEVIPQTGIIKYIFIAIRSTAGIYIFEAAFSMTPHIISKSKKSYFLILGVFIVITFLNISIPTIILGCFLMSILMTVRERYL